MAEQEEKTNDIIYVFTQEQVCKICEGKRHGICDCCYWKQMPHLSRQEAIERMTVAMCKFDCTDNERACENCNEWEKYDKCESLAEAALNALLSGDK